MSQFVGRLLNFTGCFQTQPQPFGSSFKRVRKCIQKEWSSGVHKRDSQKGILGQTMGTLVT